MGDMVNLQFAQVIRREWDIAVDIEKLRAAVATHAPEWSGWSSFAEALADIATYGDKWTLIMNEVHTVDDGIVTDVEIEDFESDAGDFETCSDCGEPLDEHCEDCGECECECNEEDDEEEEE